MSSKTSERALETEAGLLVDFVNTYDVEEHEDEIAEPDALLAWIDAHTEIEAEPGAAVDPAAHKRLLDLREALRGLLRAHGGHSGEIDLSPLEGAAARSSYRASLRPDGTVCIDADGDGVRALEARLLLAIEFVQLLGAWPRVKACAAEDCQWAFYDSSRNRSRTWCSMEVCGNRQKTRRYRDSRSSG